MTMVLQHSGEAFAEYCRRAQMLNDVAKQLTLEQLTEVVAACERLERAPMGVLVCIEPLELRDEFEKMMGGAGRTQVHHIISQVLSGRTRGA